MKSTEGREMMIQEVAMEIRSFTPMLVWDDDTLQKSIKLVRPAQIIWDKKEDEDDISKSRSGIYANTSENKKMGRVGMKYGGSKDADSNKHGADGVMADDSNTSQLDEDVSIYKEYKQLKKEGLDNEEIREQLAEKYLGHSDSKTYLDAIGESILSGQEELKKRGKK
jgi:hypothetical protein